MTEADHADLSRRLALAIEWQRGQLFVGDRGVDLAQGDSIMAIVVCAQQQDGRVYELGHVSAAAVYQDPQGARRAIERIKWCAIAARGASGH